MISNARPPIKISDYQLLNSILRQPMMTDHPQFSLDKKRSDATTSINMRMEMSASRSQGDGDDHSSTAEFLHDHRRSAYEGLSKPSSTFNRFDPADVPNAEDTTEQRFGDSDSEQNEPLDFSRKPAETTTRTKVKQNIEKRTAELQKLSLRKSPTYPRQVSSTSPPPNQLNGRLPRYTHPYELMSSDQFQLEEVESIMNGHHHNSFGLPSAAVFQQEAYHPFPEYRVPSPVLAPSEESFVKFRRQVLHLQKMQQQGGHLLSVDGHKRGDKNRQNKLNALLALHHHNNNDDHRHHRAKQNFLNNNNNNHHHDGDHHHHLAKQNFIYRRTMQPAFSTNSGGTLFVQRNGGVPSAAAATAPKANGEELADLPVSPTPSSSRSSTPPRPPSVPERSPPHRDVPQPVADLGHCTSPTNSTFSNEDSMNTTRHSSRSGDSPPLSVDCDAANLLQVQGADGQPLAAVTKKRGRSLPDELKDEAYWERRRKNNEAAKRSRDARRAKEDEIAIRAAYLEQENLKLRVEVTALKSETTKLRCLLYNA